MYKVNVLKIIINNSSDKNRTSIKNSVSVDKNFMQEHDSITFRIFHHTKNTKEKLT